MNGVEGSQNQVLWVIQNPLTLESGITHITQAISLSQGIRPTSPPPLVPIRGATKVMNDERQNWTIQSPNSTVGDAFHKFLPKRVLLQTDNTQDAAKCFLLEKNQDIPMRSCDQAGEPATEEVRHRLKLLCRFCSRPFLARKALFNHQYLCLKNPRSKRKVRVECPHCYKTYMRKAHLEAHWRSNGCDKIPLNRMCEYPDCSFKFRFRTVFMEHLREVHKVDIEPGREMLFDNWEQFFKWKDAEEERTFSYYSQQFGKKNNRAYFYCQHDGPNRGKVAEDQNALKLGKRGPNQKGKIKTGKMCFSMIHVHGVNKEGQLRATYFPTHSHEPDAADLKFQPSNAATRQYIREQIAKGVSPETISERLKEETSVLNNSVPKSKVPCRTDFISVRSIKEQKRVFSRTINFLDDLETAQEIVDNLRVSSYDPVLIFRPSGGHESATIVPQDSFILGIQTKEQLEMMRECSKSTLILDVNWDVTQYGCKLLTVFGVDERNRGYPLAHCISSSMDEATLQQFFAAIKERSPDLCVNAFLTEGFDTNVINAARKGLDDDGIQHVVCTSSFLTDLQRKLRAKVEDESLAASLFGELSDIVLAKTETEFDRLLADFRQKHATLKSSCMRYLNGICIPKKTQWAMCFRNVYSRGIDTMLFAESFHNSLKNAYLKQELNKGLVTLVNLLMQTEKDFYARRWTTDVFICPSGPEPAKENVSLQHTKSITLPDVKVEQVVDSFLWKVRSQKSDKVHQVVRCSSVCTNPSVCCFRCSSCLDLCVHLYVCSCKDQNPLCKHIHKVHSMNPSREVDDSLDRQSSREEEILFLLAKLREHVESASVKKLHPRILRTLSELNAQCSETVALNEEAVSLNSSKNRKIAQVEAPQEKNSGEVCSSTQTVCEQFTPPIDYVDNLNQVIFKLEDESFSLVSIKSLEPWLPPEDVGLLQNASAGKFRVGWLYENIVNTYLSVLATEYPDFIPFDVSVMQSLLDADKETFKTFWIGLRTLKVIFIPMVTGHYISAAVLVDEQTVITYDPIVNSSIGSEIVNALKSGLALAFPGKLSWSLMKFPGTQEDTSQSGVNICVFAEQVARGEVHYQTVNDARSFRKSIYDSIFGHCLKRSTFIHNRCDICKEVARANSIGTFKCVRCSQLFHRMCLQLEPDETCVCPLILLEC